MTDVTKQDRITGFWSDVARHYEAVPGNVCARDGEEYRAWVRALGKLLPPAPADVLDVGTGTGFVAAIAAGLGHRVEAIDLAEPMLAEARTLAARAGLAIRFSTGDAVAPPFAAQSFDAVVSRHLLWTLRDFDAAARAWRELLRPGGRVIAIDGFTPMPATDITGEGLYTDGIRASLPGWRYADVAPYQAVFEAAGFSSVTVETLDEIQRASTDPDPPLRRALTAYA